MFRWDRLQLRERVILVLVIAATTALAVRGVNAMIHTDHLPDWLTMAALLGVPIGWAYVTYIVDRHRT